jgi:hypothetical protein
MIKQIFADSYKCRKFIVENSYLKLLSQQVTRPESKKYKLNMDPQAVYDDLNVVKNLCMTLKL